MKAFLAVAAVVLLGAIGFYVYSMHQERELIESTPIAEEVRGEPTFAWSYQESEREGIPYSEILLTATYPDGASETKSIDTVEGSCNAYEETDADVYEKSSMTICYYAGLGRYFKVVRDGDAYLVQRKVFEEASPEYDPPVLPYETVATF